MAMSTVVNTVFLEPCSPLCSREHNQRNVDIQANNARFACIMFKTVFMLAIYTGVILFMLFTYIYIGEHEHIHG